MPGTSLAPRLRRGQGPMVLPLVARFYERPADHAVNIARRVVYLAGSVHR